MSELKRLVITSFARTPFDSQRGAEFIEMTLPELAVAPVKAVIERSKLGRSEVDGLVMGNVSDGGQATNLGRHVALKANLDYEKALAYTVNRVCGSGFQAVASCMMELWCDQGKVYIAAGAEMCQHHLMSLPMSVLWTGLKPGTPIGAMQYDGDPCAPNEIYGRIYGPAMTVEKSARKYGITREDADKFAFESQSKMKAAVESGRFDCEIIPFEARHTGKKGKVETVVYDKDLHPKPYTTMEGLAGLKPAFEENGTITAGNASGSNSGSAALVIMPEEEAKARGLEPIAYLNAFAFGGVDPTLMGMGPVAAITNLFKRTGLGWDDIDVLDINEAFATQCLACVKAMNPETYMESKMYKILNPNGGAVSIGHPLGATGARITGTVAQQLRITGKRFGIASACIGGGQGAAILLENYQK